MRILMVSKACLVGTYQTKLEALAAVPDIELAVLVPPSWRDPAGEIKLERSHTAGYTLWVEPIRFNGQFHIHYYPTLSKRLRMFRPDILHMDEEPYNLATWLGVRQARRLGVKSLFFTWQNLYRRYPFPFSWLEQDVLRKADFGIMGNQAAVDVFQRKGYRGPYRVIPQFGVSAEIFRPPAERERGRDLIIGFAGRLVPEKGVDLLLKAVAMLTGNWRLHIAGSGPERPRLEQMVQSLAIRERVFFDGALPSTRIPAYLQELDVLVLPSRSRPNWEEQFGRILVEAMACGVAVIGSSSGEIPYVIGDAGLIFAENEAAELAAALQRVLESARLRDELGEAGRQRVLRHYTQTQIAAETVDVYREMLKAKSVVLRN